MRSRFDEQLNTLNNKMIEKKAKPLLFSIKTRRTRHQKDSSDNMKQKIIVKFCNFIPEFFNGVLKGNLFKPPINTIIFRKIPYKCKTKKFKILEQIRDNVEVYRIKLPSYCTGQIPFVFFYYYRFFFLL